ncbi:MAG: hypothetical protein PHP00_04395 [Thiotrichaceae bacterium]|nr:hypothetical protein [Thiotrichaceae bacterium]
MDHSEIVGFVSKKDELGFADFLEVISKYEIEFSDFDIYQVMNPIHHFRHEFLEYVSTYGLSSLRSPVTVEIVSRKDGVGLADFREVMKKHTEFSDFDLDKIAKPVCHFRHEFLEYVSTHGFSSLYDETTLFLEDLTSPSMTINEVELVVKRFTGRLQDCENLFIIDPYFFASSDNAVKNIFEGLLDTLSNKLKCIYFFTNSNDKGKSNILSVCNSRQIPHYEIETNEFHDRFWIDPDNCLGIVMGTSLNGIGKKIALIDKLQQQDVIDVTKLACDMLRNTSHPLPSSCSISPRSQTLFGNACPSSSA